MSTLESFGIKPGSDERHLIMAGSSYLKEEEFFQQAEAKLAEVAPVVLEEVVPHLEKYSGRWNPGGFMAFPLGLHDELGQLRLHIWPESIERESSDGPNIHNHSWYLSSLILAGVYSDKLFKLHNWSTTDPEIIKDEGLVEVFQTIRNPAGQDAFVSTGRFVKPVSSFERVVTKGATHRIVPEMYHVTTVPVDQLAVTLIFDSHAFDTTTEVLIDSNRAKGGRMRKEIEPESIILAKEQILQGRR